MAGYPNKFTRSAFPTMENVGKIRNPNRDVDAAWLNLMFWQLAGINGLVPRGFQLCTIAAGVLTKGRKWLAWDPNGALSASAFDVVRTGSGVFTWSLSSSSFADKDGVSIAVASDWAIAIPMGTANINMIADVNANGYQGTINAFTANTGAAVDPAKFVLLIG